MFVPHCLIAWCLASSPGSPDAPADGGVLARAEAAFRQGVSSLAKPGEARKSFRAAAEGYEELRRRGFENADLYRNQGNAYLLAGDLPQAVLAYRRGLHQAPHDRALQENLEYARDQVQYPSGNRGRPPADDWPPWLPRPAAEFVFILAAALYSLACVAATRWLMTRRRRLMLAGAALTGAVLLAGFWAFQQWQAWRETAQPLVVVAQDGVPLYRGNGTSYPRHGELPALNRGMEARVRFTRDDWLQIELAGGEVGWVERSQVVQGIP